MIYAGDFRKGITFQINGEPHVVLDFQHVKPGKGAAFVRTKYRNILTDATRKEAFNVQFFSQFRPKTLTTPKCCRFNEQSYKKGQKGIRVKATLG